ncbi:MAG: carboxypeptidase-like regulatory domain-containing protein [Candidatus Korobacteraceae bacterium]|jgi:protocatechuate 3,4-dioxygenase beta subunit
MAQVGKAVVLVLVLALAASQAFGQGEAGTLSGTVLDATGAVVKGATVTVTRVSTDAQRSVPTRNEGQYTIPGLSPGTYLVKITCHSPKLDRQKGIDFATA